MGGGFVKTPSFEIHLEKPDWLATVMGVLLLEVGLFILLYTIRCLQESGQFLVRSLTPSIFRW